MASKDKKQKTLLFILADFIDDSFSKENIIILLISALIVAGIANSVENHLLKTDGVPTRAVIFKKTYSHKGPPLFHYYFTYEDHVYYGWTDYSTRKNPLHIGDTVRVWFLPYYPNINWNYEKP